MGVRYVICVVGRVMLGSPQYVRFNLACAFQVCVEEKLSKSHVIIQFHDSSMNKTWLPNFYNECIAALKHKVIINVKNHHRLMNYVCVV